MDKTRTSKFWSLTSEIWNQTFHTTVCIYTLLIPFIQLMILNIIGGEARKENVK